ncbi:MAG TPA: sugar phosphate isomerase/epimerase [Casimicrobiaceae bacterium]|nr:sugar phosphate isomerase/epimerase [Casimicrobiaceae bacterium]
MPILTLGWLTLLNTKTADVITAAAESNFKSVSIRITGRKLSDGYEPIVGNPATMRELRRRLDDNGLRLSNTSVYHLSPDIRLEHVLPAMDATVELGTKIMVATCTDPDHERWVRFMQRYCEAAAQRGITLALEFVPFSEAKTIEVGYDLVLRTGADNFGLLIDPLHLSRSGGTPADIAKVDPKRIVFVQLCDAVAQRPPPDQLAHEARTGRRYPGDGALPLYDFLDALPDAIEIECEMPRSEDAHLSGIEQARHAGAAIRSFLDAYCDSRGRERWR